LATTNQITPTIAASTTNPTNAIKPSGIGDETLISAHPPLPAVAFGQSRPPHMVGRLGLGGRRADAELVWHAQLGMDHMHHCIDQRQV
jgi:hypothetical protein